jgi:hypothetical protein
LVKGLRVAGAKTLEQANAYLEAKFIPWWDKTLAVTPASSDDAHRPLDKKHSLAASLSYVETRQVGNDYTIQFDNQTYQIACDDIRVGLRGAQVRVEVRLDASLAVRFRARYVAVSQCHPRPKASPAPQTRKPTASRPKSQDEKLSLHQPGKSRAVRHPVSTADTRSKTYSVGRARTARPASRLLYSKPPLGSLTKVSSPQKAKPPEGTPQGPVNRGLAAVYFGANSVAFGFESSP